VPGTARRRGCVSAYRVIEALLLMVGGTMTVLFPQDARPCGADSPNNGFRTYRALELALYHTLGDLPEPQTAHRFNLEAKFLVVK
jgi:hypothetical protein